ncbi:copper homeostasis protein CutC [Chromatiaceae bacterium AAb-1]|nr:copper homeostasis protein CutC [Chromatiaceae bacterium AAb-1]
MIALEACINADDVTQLAAGVEAAAQGGAARIELCAAMADEGLTPALPAIMAARQAFSPAGLLVMIRPRAGDFCYSQTEFQQMQSSIAMAADAGADGVVLGMLNERQLLDLPRLRQLMQQCRRLQLQVSFHRAFDVLANPYPALEQLIDLGVKRLLTSGIPWGSEQGVLQGLPQLRQYQQRAAGRIELVIGGGVQLQNLPPILAQLQSFNNMFSIHCYSALLCQGRVDVNNVRRITRLCSGLSA